ncbi:MAG: tyrosine-type recombinase/integrase [Chromatiaceae bacterium]
MLEDKACRASITDLRWHDLRYAWASWHVQAGTPLHVLQELGGWATASMGQRYAHLATDHLASHTERIAAPLALVTEDEEYMREDVCIFSGTPEKKKAP